MRPIALRSWLTTRQLSPPSSERQSCPRSVSLPSPRNAVAGLDQRVDAVRIRRRDRDADLADVARSGRPLPLQPRPRRRRRRATTKMPLPGPPLSRPQVWISICHMPAKRMRGFVGIHHEVGAAGVLVDEQHASQVLPPSVVRKTPRSGCGPYAWPSAHASTMSGFVGCDDDLADAAGLLEPHLRPGLAGVGRLVDALADRDVAADAGFAGAGPDDVRIGGRDGERADRLHRLAVEDRLPVARRRRWSCRCRPTPRRRSRRADRRARRPRRSRGCPRDRCGASGAARRGSLSLNGAAARAITTGPGEHDAGDEDLTESDVFIAADSFECLDAARSVDPPNGYALRMRAEWQSAKGDCWDAAQGLELASALQIGGIMCICDFASPARRRCSSVGNVCRFFCVSRIGGTEHPLQTVEPAVIPSNSSSGAVVTVRTDLPASSVVIDLEAGGTVSFLAISSTTFSVALTPVQLLFDYSQTTSTETSSASSR